MSAPRLEIRLDHLHHNARSLVERLAPRGITVTGVTKATLGNAEIAREMLRAGVGGLGDSRVDNIESLRYAGVSRPITLLRSPMPSEVDRVVEHAEISLNTDEDVIDLLSASAVRQGHIHGVVLMVELGDLREGILPADLERLAGQVLRLPGVTLRGIGTNLACQSGVVPDAGNMGELSSLVESVERRYRISIETVSGGNSANLPWAMSAEPVGRINELRLGEAILLGREPSGRTPIDGLHLDAFTLVAEVIESKVKPSAPRGSIGQAAFGASTDEPVPGTSRRALLAVGRQDIDPDGLTCPTGFEIVGSSSDHLVLDTGGAALAVGAEVRFGVNYSALLRAMTSPFVSSVFQRAPAVSPLRG